MRGTGLHDKNGTEIIEGNRLRHYGYPNGDYFVRYGKGSYDMGLYTYLGFYLENCDNGNTDGRGWLLFKSEDIEVVEDVMHVCELCEDSFPENDMEYIKKNYPWPEGWYCADCKLRTDTNPIGDDI